MPQMPRSLPNGEACLSRRTLPPLKQPNSSIRPTRADGGQAAGSRRFRLKRRVGRDFSFCFRMVAGIGRLAVELSECAAVCAGCRSHQFPERGCERRRRLVADGKGNICNRERRCLQ